MEPCLSHDQFCFEYCGVPTENFAFRLAAKGRLMSRLESVSIS